MLIIALAVLTLMSIIAVTFAALMRLERRATENFVNATSAELLASSAESAVIAMLRGGTFWDGHSDMSGEGRRAEWLYGLKHSRGDLRYGNLMPLTDTPPEQASLWSDLGATYGGEESRDRYRVKLIDCNSQIYLNGDQDTLAGMLENLGKALEREEEIKKNPLFTGPNQTGKQIRGRDILLYRNKLPGRKFASKAQLKDLLGEENYRIIADYVTAHAWVNPYTVRSGDGREPTKLTLDADNTALTSVNFLVNPGVEGAPNLIDEPRAPININTAPRPVLVACLTGIGGRRPFPYTELTNQNFENANRGSFDVDGTLPNTQEEFRLLQIPVWIYSTPLTIDQARKIADEIIRARKEHPFKVWRSGDLAQPGFEEFVNQLPEQLFPPPSSFKLVNPRDPANNGRYRSGVTNNEGSREMWQRGHDGRERGARRAAGMAVSGANAWYFDMVRDMLKSNFNPNARLNKFNPNSTAYVSVDKSGILRLGNNGQDENDVHVAHTTEFCFDSMGIYEISTVAEIVVGDSLEDIQVFAESQRRSVVKVFDVLHHTTQRQFEQPYNERGRSSFRDRQNVSTYPDAMDALEPDFFHGSRRDGRIELSGATDAKRQAVRPELRGNTFAQSSNLRLGHGFRFREPGAGARLNTTLERFGLGSTQALVELKALLDPEYCFKGGQFRNRYSKEIWKAADAESEIENIDEPIVATSAFNGDIQPDGLHMSFMRVLRTGTRILRFPAIGFREVPGAQGEVRQNYTNDIGNLPYYQGGVAFWIKLEFDGIDPIFHGLLKATQVQTRVGQNPEDSEGTQFFVWKNTTGELRVSRLYYHQAFFRDDTAQAYPLIGDEEDLEQEDYELDPRKTWARTDLVVDVSDWKAREWHHLVIQYDDDLDADRVKVRIDGEPLDFVTNHSLGLTKFCALNEEEPKDEIQIGGVFRDQAVAGEGIFKFGTNVAQRSMQETAPSVKKIPANATIDEFQTFLGFYDPGSQDLSYFTRDQGRYTNRFEVPFPEGIQRIRLRSFTWTMYPPTMYAGLAVRWNAAQDFEAGVSGVNGNPGFQRLGDAGGEMTLNAQIAGEWLRPDQSNTFGRTGSLGYEFKFNGATGQQKFGDRVVASPVIDDVTLTYYLSSAEILVSEGLE